MPEQTTNRHGGFHIGKVGGNVDIKAGGDLVGGDKIATTTTTTIKGGFQDEEAKTKFQEQIAQLRGELTALREKLGSTDTPDRDRAAQIGAELGRCAETLKNAGEKAATLPAGREASKGTLDEIASALSQTEKMVKSVSGLAETGSSIATSTIQFLERVSPLIHGAAGLLGLWW